MERGLWIYSKLKALSCILHLQLGHGKFTHIVLHHTDSVYGTVTLKRVTIITWGNVMALLYVKNLENAN